MSRAAAGESPVAPLPTEPESVLLVASGGRSFGIPMGAVREVVPTLPTVGLPGASDAVLGLTSVRGRIVTVLDLPAALGLRPAEMPDPRVVLVEHRGRVLGLRVEDVRRMVRLGPGDETEEHGAIERIDLDALFAPYFR